MSASPTDGLISIEKALVLDLCLGVPLGSAWLTDEVDPAKGDVPDLVLLRGDQLAMLRQLAAAGDRRSADAVQALIPAVDRLLDMPLLSVVHKAATPPSRNKHDYFSVPKYWWDEDKTNSWVRRDGQVNPASRSDNYDAHRLMVFAEGVLNLAIAGYLTSEKKYSSKAADLVRCWFLDPSTCQSPHFDYAQVLPGQGPKGRGIIEARHMVYVTEAVRLLEHSAALTPSELVELRRWFSMLLDWMTHSAKGKHASNANNNIGIWFDLQCIAYALFCGQNDRAKQFITSTSLPRILDQIEADGTIPAELSRSRPYDYTAFTMVAMAQISRSAERLGIKIWDSEQAEGRALQLAQDWLRRAGALGQSEVALTHLAATARTQSEPDNSDESFRRMLDLAVQMRLLGAGLRLNEAETRSAEAALQEATAALREAEQAAQRFDRELKEATTNLESIQNRLDLVTRSQFQLGMELAEIYTSRSWKITGAHAHCRSPGSAAP